jgi:bifunctional DNA-binding transcriptional regulator/antitoxin component of YhaV-PrlF toxin-antitoxin module
MAKVKDQRAERSPRRRRNGTTRLSTKNQATIPVQALREAGIQPGDELKVTASGPGKILLEREVDPLEQVKGALHGVYPPDYLQKLRAEWD